MRHLTVTIEGSGTIRSYPAGIDCQGSCAADFPAETQVRLVAMPERDWMFETFAGGCAAAYCEMTLSSDTSVLARFKRPPPAVLSVALTGDGSGRVTSLPPGIDCPVHCTAAFVPGTKIRLSASPDALTKFGGWAGACTGNSCVLTIRGDAAAVVRFELQRYAVTDILGPTSASTAMSLHTGLVAGYYENGRSEFFWDGLFHEVGLPWPTDIHGINDSGTIAGVHDWHAFRWFRGVTTDLGTLGGETSIGEAINGDGVVAGWAQRSDSGIHAAYWSNGPAVDLGAIGDPAGCDYSAAFGINSDGIIVGESCVPGGTIHPVRFRDPGVIDDLGSWGGTYARAVHVNDRGVILGYATRPGQSTYHAFVWTEGTMLDAGSLPGFAHSYLGCINSRGVAAGISFDDTDVVRRGVVWGSGRMLDLNELVVPGPYLIDSAACIDEHGRIAATAISDGTSHAVLLIPL